MEDARKQLDIKYPVKKIVSRPIGAGKDKRFRTVHDAIDRFHQSSDATVSNHSCCPPVDCQPIKYGKDRSRARPRWPVQTEIHRVSTPLHSSIQEGISDSSEMKVINDPPSDLLIIAKRELNAALKEIGELKQSITMFQENDRQHRIQMKKLWCQAKKLEQIVAKLTEDCTEQSQNVARLMAQNAKALNEQRVHSMGDVNKATLPPHEYDKQIRNMKCMPEQMAQQMAEIQRENDNKVAALDAAQNRALENAARLEQLKSRNVSERLSDCPSIQRERRGPHLETCGASDTTPVPGWSKSACTYLARRLLASPFKVNGK